MKREIMLYILIAIFSVTAAKDILSFQERQPNEIYLIPDFDVIVYDMEYYQAIYRCMYDTYYDPFEIYWIVNGIKYIRNTIFYLDEFDLEPITKDITVACGITSTNLLSRIYHIKIYKKLSPLKDFHVNFINLVDKKQIILTWIPPIITDVYIIFENLYTLTSDVQQFNIEFEDECISNCTRSFDLSSSLYLSLPKIINFTLTKIINHASDASDASDTANFILYID